MSLWSKMIPPKWSSLVPKKVPDTEVDFVFQFEGHKCAFTHGNNVKAYFIGDCPAVQQGDVALLKMQSGRIGRFHLYELERVGVGNKWTAIGAFIGYKEAYIPVAKTPVFGQPSA